MLANDRVEKLSVWYWSAVRLLGHLALPPRKCSLTSVMASSGAVYPHPHRCLWLLKFLS